MTDWLQNCLHRPILYLTDANLHVYPHPHVACCLQMGAPCMSHLLEDPMMTLVVSLSQNNKE